jgi:hypothetical protein
MTRTTICDAIIDGVTFEKSENIFKHKTDSHDIAEILLKVALNTKTLTLKHHSTNVGFLITGTMLEGILCYLHLLFF